MAAGKNGCLACVSMSFWEFDLAQKETGEAVVSFTVHSRLY